MDITELFGETGGTVRLELMETTGSVRERIRSYDADVIGMHVSPINDQIDRLTVRVDGRIWREAGPVWTLLWEGRPQTDEGLRDNPIMGLYGSEALAKAALAEVVEHHAQVWSIRADGTHATNMFSPQRLIINSFTVQEES